MRFLLQDLKFWPTTSYTEQLPTNTVFNKFSTKLAYEPIASPTENTSSIDRHMPLERSYQSSCQNRTTNHISNNEESIHSDFVTDEHTVLGTSKTYSNGWLSSLQTFSVDLGNSIGNTLSGNVGSGGTTAFMSSEHQPLSGVDSEFAEDSIENSKYTYWSIQWLHENEKRKNSLLIQYYYYDYCYKCNAYTPIYSIRFM